MQAIKKIPGFLYLTLRESLDHRGGAGCGSNTAIRRTPEVGGEAEAQVVVGVEGGDGAEQVLEVLPGQRGRVRDPLLLVHQDVARRVVRSVAELLHLKKQRVDLTLRNVEVIVNSSI